MKITFSLSLPRDASTVPMVRRISRDALGLLGVRDSCIDDIEIATSEACTNVLKHVEGSQGEYEVKVEINPQACEIRVVDSGEGFDFAQYQDASGDLSLSAEGGRGIFLMEAMVDRLEFISAPENGTVVHLVKELELEPNSVLEQLDASVTS
jgi:serine/threonine-protein kinase RsbW